MNIDPRAFDTFMEWSDRMNLILDPLRLAEKFLPGDNWQDWASEVIDSPNLEGQNAPNPYQFRDWKEWAMRFNQVVDLPG